MPPSRPGQDTFRAALQSCLHLKLFPPCVHCGELLLLALVFFATAPAFFVQFPAYRRFLLVGALDPAVNPGRLGFHARGVCSEPEQVTADVYRARRKIRRRRLLCLIKQTFPIRAGGFRKRHLHHVKFFAQLLDRLRRPGSLDSLVRRQMVLLENFQKVPSHGDGQTSLRSPRPMILIVVLPLRRTRQC
jgi:hypothetical protein